MNRRPIVIATAIGALGGAIAVIIFLYFFNVWKIARLLTGNHTPPPASMEIDLSPDGEWFLEEKAYIEARLNHFNFRDDHHDNLAFGPHSTSAIAETGQYHLPNKYKYQRAVNRPHPQGTYRFGHKPRIQSRWKHTLIREYR